VLSVIRASAADEINAKCLVQEKDKVKKICKIAIQFLSEFIFVFYELKCTPKCHIVAFHQNL
jgi:hypothetical protein